MDEGGQRRRNVGELVRGLKFNMLTGAHRLSPVRVLIGLHLHALYSKGLSKILTFNLMFKNADKSFKETHVREAVSSKSNIGYRIVGCKIDDLMSEKTINKR